MERSLFGAVTQEEEASGFWKKCGGFAASYQTSPTVKFLLLVMTEPRLCPESRKLHVNVKEVVQVAQRSRIYSNVHAVILLSCALKHWADLKKQTRLTLW